MNGGWKKKARGTKQKKSKKVSATVQAIGTYSREDYHYASLLPSYSPVDTSVSDTVLLLVLFELVYHRKGRV
jgi:hypothetical protein